MITTGSKGLDNLLFGLVGRRNIEEGLAQARKRASKEKPTELPELEELTLYNDGRFVRHNGKMVSPRILGIQAVATPLGHIRNQEVLREIKAFRDALYKDANAYVHASSTPQFFHDTEPVGGPKRYSKGDYMCVAVLYCKI